MKLKMATWKSVSRNIIISGFVFTLQFIYNSHAVNLVNMANMFNDSIFKELSWSVKMMILKDTLNDETHSKIPELQRTKVTRTGRRIPGIESLVVKRRQEEDQPVTRDPNEDDNNMRIKLFRNIVNVHRERGIRKLEFVDLLKKTDPDDIPDFVTKALDRLPPVTLMYETVRDSDLKCKRAELIRSHYANSIAFEIGYLMGDVMDKFNIMSDIAATLKRLFHEWKPIEHINAYEQISNQAIEINHLIDMMQGVGKKNETTKKTSK